MKKDFITSGPSLDLRSSSEGKYFLFDAVYEYSQPSIARTPMARLPWLIRTRF